MRATVLTYAIHTADGDFVMYVDAPNATAAKTIARRAIWGRLPVSLFATIA